MDEMEKQYLAGAGSVTGLIEQVSSLVTLSLQEVKRIYAKNPLGMTEYAGRDEGELSLEIRLEKAQVTVTCTFNPDGVCEAVYLFPDDNRLVEHLTAYMTEAYDYEYAPKRWVGPHGYVRVEPSPFCDDETFLVCYR